MRSTIIHWIIPWTILNCLFQELPGQTLSSGSIRIISVNEGLSQSHVNAVEVDEKGFLWVGTADGLNRFDGYEFLGFHHRPGESVSISDNFIYSLAAPGNGMLYLGTRNGLNIYSFKTGEFERYLPLGNAKEGLAGARVYSVEASKKGYLWVRTGMAVQRFWPEKNKWETIQLPPDLQYTGRQKWPESMTEDSDGTLYMGTRKGIYQLPPGGNVFIPLLPLSTYNKMGEVTSFCSGPDSTIFIGTRTGLYRYKPGDVSPVRLGKKDGVVDVMTLKTDPLGNTWAGTRSGLFCIKQGSEEIIDYLTGYYNENLLELEEVCEIRIDQSGILWAASRTGLVRLDLKQQNFKRYNRAQGNLQGLSGLEIADILLDEKGLLWLAVYGHGVDVLNRSTGRVVRHYGEKRGYPISSDSVRVLFIDSSNNIWLGSESGLMVSESGRRGFVDFSPSAASPDNETLKGQRIFFISEDLDGYLWFGTQNGAYRYSPWNRVLVKIFPDDTEPIGKDFRVYFIHQDLSGNFWFGGPRGLLRLDYQTARITSIPAENHSVEPGTVSPSVFSICGINDSVLWIGTSNGLYVVDLLAKPYSMRSSDVFPDKDIINLILPDDSSNLWFSTNNGLICLKTESKSWRRYDFSDGLQSNEFNIGSGFRSPGGELFFGGVLGFNAFNPTKIQENRHIPELMITGIKVFSGRKPTQTIFHFPDRIVLMPGENTLSIRFAALDLTRPEKNLFEYKLEGYEDEWIGLTGNPEVTYHNLPYGRYVFRVRGSNSDQVWNMEGASMEVVVRASVFRSKPAQIIYIFSALFWLYLFFHYRTRSLRKANALLKEKELAGIEIARQKEELSIKNKNITDSINYAQKIQEAMLPSGLLFKQILPESFILFKPKDIVSGDFYWVNRKGDKIFIAAVDCTGHGVPGALMSMIGSELIRNIINVQGIEEPALILDKLNEGISVAFNREVERITLKDGMDLSFCAIDNKNHLLQFAGAFNPVYLVRDETITELKGDRISVGLAEDPEKERFRNHVIPLEPSDVIYMFTDGYVDQFGGPREKKFMYRRFRHLLLTIHKLGMKEQRIILEETINEWKGDTDQVDDILVIGFRPWLD